MTQDELMRLIANKLGSRADDIEISIMKGSNSRVQLFDPDRDYQKHDGVNLGESNVAVSTITRIDIATDFKQENERVELINFLKKLDGIHITDKKISYAKFSSIYRVFTTYNNEERVINIYDDNKTTIATYLLLDETPPSKEALYESLLIM